MAENCKISEDEIDVVDRGANSLNDGAGLGLVDETVITEALNEDSAAEEPPEDTTNERAVFELNGCYYKQTRGRNPQMKQVANLTLRAKVKVVSDDGWFYQCVGTRNTGEEYEIQLSKSDFMSRSAFKNALSKHSGFLFFGNSDDTTQIQGLLADQEPPVVKGTDKNGIHLVGDRMIYVEGNTVVDKDGPVTDLVYTGRTQSSRIPELMSQPDIDEDDLRAIAQDLNRFNGPSIVYLVLGFMGYCFIKEAVTGEVSHRNPFMLCQGEPGSGKSETISGIIIPVFASRQFLTNISSITECPLALNSSSTNMCPVCYDEYKYAIISKSQRRIIDNILLATYAQTPLERGRTDRTSCETQLTAPLVLAGEVKMNSPSLDHRKIEVFFSYGKRKGKEEHFKRLITQPLGAFGKGLLLHTLQLGQSSLCQQLEIQRIMVDTPINDRFRDNAALMRTGLWLIISYLESKGIDADGYKEGFAAIDAVIREVVDAAKITNVDKTIIDFGTMASTGALVDHDDYEVKGDCLSLKIGPVYGKYTRWVKRNGESEFIGKTSFLQQLADKDYFLAKKTMRIGRMPCNGIKLDLASMTQLFEVDFPGYTKPQGQSSLSEESSGDSEDDDESWADSQMTDEEYDAVVAEVNSAAFQAELYNNDMGFTAMKDGELTLSGLLQEILYSDQSMELEFILDELFRKGWNPTDHHNGRVVKMLMVRSPLFYRGCNGWYCPSSSRRYY